jgi:hypothetical protein
LQDVLVVVTAVGDMIHQGADEQNPQATHLPPLDFGREDWWRYGEDIEGRPGIDKFNEKLWGVVSSAANFHRACAIDVSILADIDQSFFER